MSYPFLMQVSYITLCSKSLSTCNYYDHRFFVAVAVQPYAVSSVSGVTIEWSTPTVNTGCDGHMINEYVIRYNPVGSTDIHEIPVQPSEQKVVENINDTLSLTQYEYTVVIIDPNGTDVSSDIRYFTTENYRELFC